MIDVVLGLQYGDEGKGNVVYQLSKNYLATCRWNGGPNAGHTIYKNGKKIVLHQVPVGILHNKVAIIGNGVVLDLDEFVNEVKMLESLGYPQNLIYLSDRAHIITSEQKEREIANGDDIKIGTTKKGIGPCYADKHARTGKRVIDIKSEILDLLPDINICNISSFINNLNDRGNILAEGAQGFGLDIDHGDYPFVSSSNSTIGGVLTGLGVSPKMIGKIYGVIKPYSTKVGTGDFVSEIQNKDIEQKIREIADEFGATTGRPRKTGWLDITQLADAIMINGVTDLVITKCDIVPLMPEFNLYLDGPKLFNKWNYIVDKEFVRFIEYISYNLSVNISNISFGKDENQFISLDGLDLIKHLSSCNKHECICSFKHD